MMRIGQVAVAALMLAACSEKASQSPEPSAPAPHSVTAAPTPTEKAALDPAYAGLWQPFDTASNTNLGTLDVQQERLVFSKGLTLRFDAISSQVLAVKQPDGAASVTGPDTLCGKEPVRSVSFQLTRESPSKVLRVSVHDIATGPGPDPDFDLHRCQTFTYVRD